MDTPLNRDAEHLRLLSIFHYVSGAVTGLFASLPLLHVAVGIALLSGAFPQPVANGQMPGANAPMPPAAFGWVFITLGGLAVLFGWTCAGLIVFAGRCLAHRMHYTFCLIVAGIECLFVPYGTVLGVCTLLVLLRESVKPLFDTDQRVF